MLTWETRSGRLFPSLRPTATNGDPRWDRNVTQEVAGFESRRSCPRSVSREARRPHLECTPDGNGAGDDAEHKDASHQPTRDLHLRGVVQPDLVPAPVRA